MSHYPEDPGHVAGSPTSSLGAEHAKAFAPSQRARVLLFIQERGYHGATDEEVTRALGLRKSSETARRRELELANEVFDSGRERQSVADVPNAVWVGFQHFVNPGYRPADRGKDREVRRLRKLLLMAAASNQGGHSAAGSAIAVEFGIPFPLTMANLEKYAVREGFNPEELWPWLKAMRKPQGDFFDESER